MTIQEKAEKPGDAADGPPAMEVDQDALKPDFLRAMQRALNTSRRIEARTRKLQEERNRKILLWQEYEAKMKQHFLEQMKAYDQDMKKIATELEALQKQKKEAMDNVTHIAETGESIQPTAVKEVLSEHDHGVWKRFVQESQAGSGDDVDPWLCAAMGSPGIQDAAKSMMQELCEENAAQDELFRSKLRALQNDIRDIKQKQLGVNTTPPRRPTQGLMMTPPPPSSTAGGSQGAKNGDAGSQKGSATTSVEHPLLRHVETFYVGDDMPPAGHDPYMASPGNPAQIVVGGGTPPPQVAAFGPIRTPKRHSSRDMLRPPKIPHVEKAGAPAIGQQVQTSGSLTPQEVAATIIDDDPDGDELNLME